MTALHHVHTGGPAPLGLLLVHALGADLRMWDDFVLAWRRPESIVACDLRNAGRSPRSGAPISPARHAEDLEELRRHCGLDRVVVIGCAIGTLAAAAYAAAHPDRAAGLVLANPALRTADGPRAMLAERAGQVRRKGVASILPGAVDRAFLEQPRDDRYDRYMARFAEQDAEAYALSCEAVLDADASQDLGRVRCPGLVVSGAHDVLLPPAVGREVHALLPGSRFEIDDAAAHFIPYQNPRGFRDRVSAFLDDDVLPTLARSRT